MKTIVLDTSALMRLYIPDGPIPAGLEQAIEAALRSEVVLVVPELALAEAAQVLHKKTQAQIVSQAEADEILEHLLALPLDVVSHRDLAAPALGLARKHKLTVYDGLFLAAAQKHHAQLLTADAALAKALPLSTGL